MGYPARYIMNRVTEDMGVQVEIFILRVATSAELHDKCSCNRMNN